MVLWAATADCGPPHINGMELIELANTLAGTSFTLACARGQPVGSSSSSSSSGVNTTTVTCLDSGLWDYGDLACPGEPAGRTLVN